jgi:hypothetical protein
VAVSSELDEDGPEQKRDVAAAIGIEHPETAKVLLQRAMNLRIDDWCLDRCQDFIDCLREVVRFLSLASDHSHSHPMAVADRLVISSSIRGRLALPLFAPVTPSARRRRFRTSTAMLLPACHRFQIGG